MPTTRANEIVVRALSIGAAASAALSSPGAALRVHSVFRSTMNLVVEGAETLVALTGPSGCSYAHAVVLGRDQDFLGWPHPVGSTGRIDGSFIWLHNRGNRRAVDFGRARRRPPRALPTVPRLGSAYRSCVRGLSRLQADLGCDLRLCGLNGQGFAVTAMGEVLRRSALALGAAASAAGAPPEALRRAVSSLVGRGSGLTPSGDDFLCGFMAAARCAGERRVPTPAGVAALVSTLREAVQDSIRSTGEISASNAARRAEGGLAGAARGSCGSACRGT